MTEMIYPFRAVNNADFPPGKPVNTAPDWTGHVTNPAYHCMNRGPKPVLSVSKAIRYSYCKE